MSKRWKGLTVDYGALVTFDQSEPICIVLNQMQVALLKAALIPFYWDTRWYNTSVDAATIRLWVAQLDNALDGGECLDMEFRDNPADACEVQYSKDGGLTWSTMFRKDICPAGDITINTLNEIADYKTTISNNETTWNYDIVNIAPQWEWTDTDTDRAICYAVSQFVDLICNIAIEQIASENVVRHSWDDWFDTIVKEISAMGIALATAVSVPGAVAGALVWGFAVLGDYIWDWWITLDDGVFRDEDAKDEVKCHIYQHLRGQTPQYENWVDAMSLYNDHDSDNAVWIHESCYNFAKELDVYINYLLMVEDLNSIASGLPVCDCPETGEINQLYGYPAEELYGTALTVPATIAVYNLADTPSIAPASYSGEATQLYVGVPNPIGGVAGNVMVYLPNNVLVTQVTVRLTCVRPGTGTYGDKNCAVWLGTPGGGGSQIIGYSWGAGTGAQSITLNDSDPAGLLPVPHNRLYIHNSIDKNDGAITIQWIYIAYKDYVAP